jgi:predicted nucleotidyltransferase
MASMEKTDLTGLIPAVATKIQPMIDEIVAAHSRNLHSIHIVGSAVIGDYNEKLSDINSVVVLHAMDFAFIKFLAPLGKKYGKKKIAAPLVMTPEYIQTSLDAFPIEFLDFKLIHRTIYGGDILRDVTVNGHNLRLQCEREIKTKLIHLRQGYLSSLGKKDALKPVLIRSITGSMALFRAIITLLGKEPPVPRAAVVKMFSASTSVKTDIFEKMLMLKAGAFNPSEQELRDLFEQYYLTLEAIGKIIDEIPA